MDFEQNVDIKHPRIDFSQICKFKMANIMKIFQRLLMNDFSQEKKNQVRKALDGKFVFF